MQNIMISVIIPTFNRAEYLERCLRSVQRVIESDYADMEIIVVDGRSTDGTADVIRRFPKVNIVYISEPDRGAADAVNKGILMARGDVIRYFSDDDEMVSGENAYFARYLIEHPDVDVISGHANYFLEDTNGAKVPLQIQQLTGELRLETFGLTRGYLTHEATFFRKSVFAELGGYDINIRHSFDIELWWRILSAGKRIIVLDKIIVNRYFQPTSNSRTHDETIFREFTDIFRRYHAWRILCRFYWTAKFRAVFDKKLLFVKRFFGIISLTL